jgi:hypothetical protein
MQSFEFCRPGHAVVSLRAVCAPSAIDSLPLLTFFGLLGYLIVLVNSLWIIFSIWRSRSALRKGSRASGPARIVGETREQRFSEGSYGLFGGVSTSRFAAGTLDFSSTC